MSDRAEEDTVAVEVKDRIAWVRFNRPEKRNCMSPGLNRQMLRVIESLEFREDVGVLVLAGEGEAWSAGMDLREYFRATEEEGLHAVRKAQREAYSWWERLRWYEKPTIAMVHGWCFGGGYGPLFACDIAIAAEDAQFGLSEINWGILPGGGASKVVADLMPLRKAVYHAMMGENLSGKQAEAQGLVTEAVPAGQLEARVGEIAAALLKKDPNTLRATKWAVRRMTEMTYANAEDYLIRAQEALHSFGGVAARKEATRQFLDEKSFKPGLGAFDTSKIER
ncbi:MAG: p-hydroxycinnamoyl CoA hydratase/lyase [Qipengyuania sp.]|nr:p-hydroxycinnamoyl CoA hydratase/lyase [Qipengyuania sp.]